MTKELEALARELDQDAYTLSQMDTDEFRHSHRIGLMERAATALRESVKDGERLDWLMLAGNGAVPVEYKHPEGNWRAWDAGRSDEDYVGDTPRAAIDAARTPAQAGEGEPR